MFAQVERIDQREIQRIIERLPEGFTVYQLRKALERVFKNITPAHYIEAGRIIGYCQGAIETYDEITKHNQPCQRAN